MGKTSTRILLLGLFIAVVAGFFLLGGNQYLAWESVKNHLETWQESARNHPVAIVLLFFFLYAGATAFSLPAAAVLTLLSGALFGRWLGTAVASLASTCGATLAMLMSRFVLREWVEQSFGKRLAPLQMGIKKEGAYYLLILRLIPLFPFFLVNLGMGLTPIRVGTFALVSWVGMLPGTFLYVNAGTEISSIKHPGDILSPGILFAFALLGLIPLLIKRIVNLAAKPQTPALQILGAPSLVNPSCDSESASLAHPANDPEKTIARPQDGPNH